MDDTPSLLLEAAGVTTLLGAFDWATGNALVLNDAARPFFIAAPAAVCSEDVAATAHASRRTGGTLEAYLRYEPEVWAHIESMAEADTFSAVVRVPHPRAEQLQLQSPNGAVCWGPEAGAAGNCESSSPADAADGPDTENERSGGPSFHGRRYQQQQQQDPREGRHGELHLLTTASTPPLLEMHAASTVPCGQPLPLPPPPPPYLLAQTASPAASWPAALRAAVASVGDGDGAAPLVPLPMAGCISGVLMVTPPPPSAVATAAVVAAAAAVATAGGGGGRPGHVLSVATEAAGENAGSAEGTPTLTLASALSETERFLDSLGLHTFFSTGDGSGCGGDVLSAPLPAVAALAGGVVSASAAEPLACGGAAADSTARLAAALGDYSMQRRGGGGQDGGARGATGAGDGGLLALSHDVGGSGEMELLPLMHRNGVRPPSVDSVVGSRAPVVASILSQEQSRMHMTDPSGLSGSLLPGAHLSGRQQQQQQQSPRSSSSHQRHQLGNLPASPLASGQAPPRVRRNTTRDRLHNLLSSLENFSPMLESNGGGSCGGSVSRRDSQSTLLISPPATGTSGGVGGGPNDNAKGSNSGCNARAGSGDDSRPASGSGPRAVGGRGSDRERTFTRSPSGLSARAIDAATATTVRRNSGLQTATMNEEGLGTTAAAAIAAPTPAATTTAGSDGAVAGAAEGRRGGRPGKFPAVARRASTLGMVTFPKGATPNIVHSVDGVLSPYDSASVARMSRDSAAESAHGSQPLAQQPSELPAEAGAEEDVGPYVWHQVHITLKRQPAPGGGGSDGPQASQPSQQLVVLLNAVDVTHWVETQERLEGLLQEEHKVLEAMFPRHVIEHVVRNAVSRAPSGGSAAASAFASGLAGSFAAAAGGAGCNRPGFGASFAMPYTPAGVASSASSFTGSFGVGGGGSALPPHIGATLSLVRQHPGLNAAAAAAMAHSRRRARTSSSGQAGLPLATAHRHVTVLFADIVGFTSMCNCLEPLAVMAFLNGLFMRFDSLCDIYGVYKVETIGDCFMAVGGLITVDGEGFKAVRGDGLDDALHALKVMSFAKAMLREVAHLTLPHNGEPLCLRVGLHSGPVTAGIVGSKMPRFCLFGDTVNTASRMESTCEPGCIHVSASTRELLPEEPWTPTGGVQVKGKGEMQTFMWRPPAMGEISMGSLGLLSTSRRSSKGQHQGLSPWTSGPAVLPSRSNQDSGALLDQLTALLESASAPPPFPPRAPAAPALPPTPQLAAGAAAGTGAGAASAGGPLQLAPHGNFGGSGGAAAAAVAVAGVEHTECGSGSEGGPPRAAAAAAAAAGGAGVLQAVAAVAVAAAVSVLGDPAHSRS